MLRVATGLRRYSAFGICPADIRNCGQSTRPLMTLDAQQQPLNGAWFWRIRLCDDFTGDPRAVVQFPGRAAKMRTDLAAVLVKEFGVRRIERPAVAAVLRVTGIDLNAVRKEFGINAEPAGGATAAWSAPAAKPPVPINIAAAIAPTTWFTRATTVCGF